MVANGKREKDFMLLKFRRCFLILYIRCLKIPSARNVFHQDVTINMNVVKVLDLLRERKYLVKK